MNNKLKELVRPSQIGLKIKRLNKNTNGVVTEAKSDVGISQFINSDALKSAGLNSGQPES